VADQTPTERSRAKTEALLALIDAVLAVTPPT